MIRQCCPFHADDDVVGVPLDAESGLVFTCTRSKGHPTEGAYRWYAAPEPPDLPGLSGLAAELGLGVELPAAIATYPGKWVEFGLVEAAYAAANPKDFAMLVARYGHTAVRPTQYSASAFLAATLGRLNTTGDVLFREGPATGRWRSTARSPGGPCPPSLIRPRAPPGSRPDSPPATSRGAPSNQGRLDDVPARILNDDTRPYPDSDCGR